VHTFWPNSFLFDLEVYSSIFDHLKVSTKTT
jgi:hypothetical protein